MITVAPFKAVRPTKDLVSYVAALPYDVMDTAEARQIVDNTPHGVSFLQVDKPELLGNAQQGDELYTLAGNLLKEWMDKGVLIQEDKESMYIYVLGNEITTQYGLVCTLSCRDYDENHIKKHEYTREAKETDRLKHIAACEAHTGPIFLAAKEMPLLTMWMEEYCQNHLAIYEFVADANVSHSVYRVSEDQVIKNIQMLFGDTSSLYIADGHHRCAAACSYARLHPENDEAQRFLGVVFPKEYLKIMDYNRVLKDTSSLEKESLFYKLSEYFEIREVGKDCFKPTAEHELGMRYQKQWYHLTLKKEVLGGRSLVECLDVSLLQDLVLAPVFSIDDPRTDEKIDFIGGIRGLDELNRRTDLDMDIAFSLYPTSMDDLMTIADSGGIMPPKSTWFEPKLLSGLLIHRI